MEQNKNLHSLIVIKECQLHLMGDLFAWLSNWMNENNYKNSTIQNTSQGYYEVLAEPDYE